MRRLYFHFGKIVRYLRKERSNIKEQGTCSNCYSVTRHSSLFPSNMLQLQHFKCLETFQRIITIILPCRVSIYRELGQVDHQLPTLDLQQCYQHDGTTTVQTTLACTWQYGNMAANWSAFFVNIITVFLSSSFRAFPIFNGSLTSTAITVNIPLPSFHTP